MLLIKPVESGRAKGAIGEMHRILDALRKRNVEAAYRVRTVVELVPNAVTAGVGASCLERRASFRNR